MTALDMPVLHRDGTGRWRLDRRGAMRVPGIVFASDALEVALRGDPSLTQAANVACLPGIVDASYAMPDIHWVTASPSAASRPPMFAQGGVVSPGGVGFDISCVSRTRRRRG